MSLLASWKYDNEFKVGSSVFNIVIEDYIIRIDHITPVIPFEDRGSAWSTIIGIPVPAAVAVMEYFVREARRVAKNMDTPYSKKLETCFESRDYTYEVLVRESHVGRMAVLKFIDGHFRTSVVVVPLEDLDEFVDGILAILIDYDDRVSR